MNEEKVKSLTTKFEEILQEVQKLESILVCRICHNVRYKFINLRCKHIPCAECFHNLIINNQEPKCHVCETLIEKGKNHPIIINNINK
jgi:hypothetical protein